MTAYAFTIDKVQIQNCRSKGDHNDSDLLTLVVTANDSAKEPTGSFRIGDNIHAGDIPTGPPPPPWVVGPYDIGDNDMVTVQMVIMNQSHTDDADKEAEAVKIGSILVAGALGVASAGAGTIASHAPLLAAESIADAALAGVIGGAGEVLGWLIGKSDPNCNGEVASHVFIYPPGELARRGTHTVANHYNPSSPSECGQAPNTTVTYSVRVWTLKQCVQCRLTQQGVDLSTGSMSLRSVQPAVTSVRAFMGL